jgi:hypothetical protein
MGFFATWTAPGRIRVICFDALEPLRQHIWDSLVSGQSDVNQRDPYSAHLVIVEAVVACYDKSVWDIRDLIRNVEMVRIPPWLLAEEQW